LKVELLTAQNTNDRVESYFAMRKITVGPDQNGIPRMLLNGEPLFQFGTLDQGWWPDGLYTAPSDEALVYDLKVTRELAEFAQRIDFAETLLAKLAPNESDKTAAQA